MSAHDMSFTAKLRMLLWTLSGIAPAGLCADLLIEAPKFAIGDTWEFAGTQNGKSYRWSRTIVELMPDSRMKVQVMRDGKESAEYFDPWMNTLPSGQIDKPSLLAKYPLAKGSTWKYSTVYDNPNWATTGEGSVVAQERVSVPFGTFECLKVETTTSHSLSRSYKNEFRTTRWYCPEIKWIAKEHFYSQTFSSANPAENVIRDTAADLVKFTPGK